MDAQAGLDHDRRPGIRQQLAEEDVARALVEGHCDFFVGQRGHEVCEQTGGDGYRALFFDLATYPVGYAHFEVGSGELEPPSVG